MGYALPSAIGQSQSHQQLTVAVSGDGSTQMNVQEFATLAALEANVIYFLINNNGYASIRNTQDSFFGQRIGSSEETGVMMPDWKKITQAYGIRYMRIGRRDKLLPAIERAIRREGPLLVEVMCQESQKIMPFVANYIDENGSLRSMPLNQMSPRRSPLPMGETMN
jgi:acetolactate synthase-1/2/3 large subunit